MVDTFAYKHKPQFGEDDELFLALPRDNCFDDIRDPASIGIDGGFMSLKESELKKVVFEPVVKQVLTLIQEQLNNAKECSAIFMVGGFGSSKYLLKRVKQEFGSVARARSCLWSSVRRIDPERLKLKRPNGPLCTDRFSTFVRKGQKVQVYECVTKSYSFTNGTRNYTTGIYAIDGNPPRYVTDVGVSELAKISISDPFKLSDPIGHKIYVEMKMYFGLNEIRTEIFVQGKKYLEELKFDGGDSY
ncbi:Heat shock 70 kDa protein 12A [Mortierella sp. AD094]|nr:Heat shock 70 kDa protein 12A [Mortierella sp. AD094]